MFKRTLICILALTVTLFFTACTTQDAESIGRTSLMLDAAGHTIINVDAPVDDNDAATKGYVDAVIDAIPLITTASGTVTINTGTTFAIVTHGLSVTPLLENIYVTPQTTLGAARYWYADNATDTTFMINLDADPVSVNVTLGWGYIK